MLLNFQRQFVERCSRLLIPTTDNDRPIVFPRNRTGEILYGHCPSTFDLSARYGHRILNRCAPTPQVSSFVPSFIGRFNRPLFVVPPDGKLARYGGRTGAFANLTAPGSSSSERIFVIINGGHHCVCF